jgi:hypothetical protein
LSFSSIPVGKDQGTCYEFTGIDEKDKDKKRRLSIRVAALKDGETWWFIKMYGPPEAVGDAKDKFEQFLKSLRIEKGRGAEQ